MLFYFLFFILSFLLYLHIKQEFVRHNNIIVYNLDYISNNNLQQCCNKKQPFVFNIQIDPLKLSLINPINIDLYDTLPITIYYTNTIESNNYKLFTGKTLLLSDTKSVVYSMNNVILINELMNTNEYMNTLKSKLISDIIPFPYKIKSILNFDYIFGSIHTKTPYEYHKNTSKYIIIMPNSDVTIRFLPYNSLTNNTKDESIYYNSDLSTFNGSTINVYTNINDNTNDNNNNDKTTANNNDKTTDNITLIYIPQYCWYSIEYNNNVSSCILVWYNNPISIISQFINK